MTGANGAYSACLMKVVSGCCAQLPATTPHAGQGFSVSGRRPHVIVRRAIGILGGRTLAGVEQ